MPPNIWNTINPSDNENNTLTENRQVKTLTEIVRIQMDIIKKLEEELSRR